LVREGKMFVKDEAKLFEQSGRCQVKSNILASYFLSPMSKLEELKSKKISGYTELDLLKRVVKVKNT